jgi:rare lipoprotein A (peptidoglycan hydrolase)
VIDLSKAAAKKIGLIKHGVAMVEIEAIRPGSKKQKTAKHSKKSPDKTYSSMPKIRVAKRGPVRKNGVAHLISLEKPDEPQLPSETIEAIEPLKTKELEPTKTTGTNSIEESFSVSSKPEPQSYSADQDDF